MLPAARRDLQAGAPPILGGADITGSDNLWAGKLSPKAGAPASVNLLGIAGPGDGSGGDDDRWRSDDGGQGRRRVAVIVPGGDPAYVAALVAALK